MVFIALKLMPLAAWLMLPILRKDFLVLDSQWRNNIFFTHIASRYESFLDDLTARLKTQIHWFDCASFHVIIATDFITSSGGLV